MRANANAQGSNTGADPFSSLSPEHEKVLKDLWTRLLDVFAQNHERSDELDRLGGPHTARTGQELTANSDSKDSGKKHKESQQVQEYRAVNDAIRKYGGRHLQQMFWRTVMMDAPDHLMLRFLRARDFNVNSALGMLVGALQFRLDVGVDELIHQGELGLRNVKGFLEQYRNRISYIEGSTDQHEMPIYFIHVARHFTNAQPLETMQKFLILALENTRLLCTPPMEKSILVFDLQGFGLKNADWHTIFFIVKCLEAYYPESIQRLYIHCAPWIFRGIWSALQPMLNANVQSKIKFTTSVKELEETIPRSHLRADMGGTIQGEWKYVEPEENENDLLKDTETRDLIQKEFICLQDKFEEATRHWLDGAPDASHRRDVLTRQLRLKYYQLAPYVRARTVYHRKGILRNDFLIHWEYPQMDGNILTQDVNVSDNVPALIQWLREHNEDTLENSIGGTKSPCAVAPHSYSALDAVHAIKADQGAGEHARTAENSASASDGNRKDSQNDATASASSAGAAGAAGMGNLAHNEADTPDSHKRNSLHRKPVPAMNQGTEETTSSEHAQSHTVQSPHQPLDGSRGQTGLHDDVRQLNLNAEHEVGVQSASDEASSVPLAKRNDLEPSDASASRESVASSPTGAGAMAATAKVAAAATVGAAAGATTAGAGAAAVAGASLVAGTLGAVGTAGTTGAAMWRDNNQGAEVPADSKLHTNGVDRSYEGQDGKQHNEGMEAADGVGDEDEDEDDAWNSQDGDGDALSSTDAQGGHRNSATIAHDFDMDDDEKSLWNEDKSFSHANDAIVAPTYTNVKVTRSMCMQSDEELRSDLEVAHEAMQLFLNSQMLEAEELCVEGAESRLYRSACMSMINVIKSLMTFEPDDLRIAIKCCKHTKSVAGVLRKGHGKLSSLLPGKSTLNDMSRLQQHAELVYAESLLHKSILSILYTGDTVGLIREAMSLRTAYLCLRNLLKMVEAGDEVVDEANRTGQSPTKSIDEDLRSGVFFNMGCCMLVLSVLEPRLLKFMEGVDFENSRPKALAFFERAGGWTRVQSEPRIPVTQEGFRRPLCDLAILVYHLVIPSSVPLPDVDLVMADHVLTWNQRRFPQGVFYLFFSSLMYVSQALPDKAIDCFRLAIDSQKAYKQLHHLCYWRLALAYLSLCEYKKASECFDLLVRESNWSKAICQYGKAAVLFEESSDNHIQAESMMRTVPSFARKMAGRHLPFERFVTLRAERFSQQTPLGLPAMEFAYLWHCLAQTPVFILLDEQLKRIDHVLRALQRFESPDSFPGGATAFYSQLCLAHFLRGVAFRYVAFPKKHTVLQYPLNDRPDVAKAAVEAVTSLTKVCENGMRLDAVDRYLVYFAHYELGNLYCAKGDFAQARFEFELILSHKALVPQTRPLKSDKASYLLSHACQMRANIAMESMQHMLSQFGPPRSSGPRSSAPSGAAPPITTTTMPTAGAATSENITMQMPFAQSTTQRQFTPTTHYNDIPEHFTRSSSRSRDISRRARQSRFLS